ncbi:MAG: ABC transporter permease [candidate division WS1 bacterium]|nr:ABC transporter permease [candidate division WS1 bacterium]
MRRLMAIARKETLHLVRDPRSLLAAFALPVLLLILYGYAVNFDLEEVPFAVVDLDQTPSSRRLIEAVDSVDGFVNLGSYYSADVAHDLFARDQAMAVIVVDRGFEQELQSGQEARVQIIIDGSNSSLASTAAAYCQAIVESAGRTLVRDVARAKGLPQALLKPAIDVRPRVLYNPNLRTQVFLVPGLIGVILMLMAALLTSGVVVREKEHGSFEILAASPIRPAELIVGKLLPYLVLATLDVALVVIAGRIFYGVTPQGSLLLLFLVSIVFLGSALALGLLFSCIMPTQQLAMLLSFLATSVPTMLLSGFAFPVRNMPWVLQQIAVVLPATHYITMVRAIILKGVGIDLLWRPLLALLAITLVLIAISVRRFSKTL